jgi:hypothetical protein
MRTPLQKGEKVLLVTYRRSGADYKSWQFGNQADQMAAAMDHRGGVVPPRADAPQIAAELEKLFDLKMKGGDLRGRIQPR